MARQLPIAISSLIVCVAILIDYGYAYKAAVYEHDVIFPVERIRVVNRTEALENMEKNLLVYSEQCNQASKQVLLTHMSRMDFPILIKWGAQIIVFPEYGVYGIGWNRTMIAPYLEFIPDPTEKLWDPCSNPRLHNDTDVQQALSCMAKRFSIYVVANLGAAQLCVSSDPHCPGDGQYQYSANVVYDSNGTFIARYFKQNLYQHETPYFDKPQKVDYTVFNTTFGRFGTFSSYDVMFCEPAISLIQKEKINNIVSPSAWKDELPLLAAIEFHSAFSMGLGINFLVANVHIPKYGYHGSGMYWPMGTSNDGVFYYNDTVNSTGKLLVHEVGTSTQISDGTKTKRVKTGETRHHLQNPITTLETSGKEDENFKAEVNHDTYTMIPIRSSYGDTQVCHNELCCNTGFEGMNFENTLYAMGAFDGMHTHSGRYYLQACIFIKCANSSTTSCGEPTKNSTSYMSKMSFSGNFSTNYVFPEVLVADRNNLEIVTRTWLYQEAIIIDVGVPGSPLSISMYARDYSRDPF